MKTQKEKYSYPYKKLKINGKCIDEHRYIMEQYLGRRLETKEVIHHLNEDTRDNRIENLRLMKDADHRKHHITPEAINRLKGYEVLKGSAHGCAKLIENDIVQIRGLLREGLTGREIAKIYGVNPKTISNIKNGRNWKHV